MTLRLGLGRMRVGGIRRIGIVAVRDEELGHFLREAVDRAIINVDIAEIGKSFVGTGSRKGDANVVIGVTSHRPALLFDNRRCRSFCRGTGHWKRRSGFGSY